MVTFLRRRELLATIGTGAVAGCAGIDSVLNGGECSFGGGSTKDEFMQTVDLAPNGFLTHTFSPERCDQLTVTATLESILDDGSDQYWFLCHLLSEELYKEFQQEGDIELFVGMERLNESKGSPNHIMDEQRFRYRFESSVDESET